MRKLLVHVVNYIYLFTVGTCASFSSNLRMISWVFILLATWKQHMRVPSEVSFFDLNFGGL